LDTNNRYRSRKINLKDLLNKETDLSSKKLDVGDILGKPVPSAGSGGEKTTSGLKDNFTYRSPREYAAIISMIVASMYLLLISFFPLVYNFTSSFEPLDFLKNLFYFTLGLGTLSGVFYLLRKENYLRQMADEAFDKEILHRLEPVLRDVADVQVGLSSMQNQIEMMNTNLEMLSKKGSTATPVASSQLGYYIKYIVLINITLAVFIFMLQYPFGYIPYAVTVIYIMWWAVITAEYRLWKIETVWTWAFIPIIILPVYTIVMNAYLPDYQLFGSLFIGLCIYIFSFYSWCTYMVKGILPFDLQDAINATQEKIKDAKEQPKKAIKTQDLTFRPGLPSRHQAVMGMFMLAIFLFAITWFGYAIQHNFIPDVSWETMGLKGFVWSVSYSYCLDLLGILLILSGIYLKKAGT